MSAKARVTIRSTRGRERETATLQRRIALFRGINVGKAKRIAMADLRVLLAGLGFTEVRTLLNSGNAVFSTTSASPAATGRRIEQALADTLGVSASVLVLDGETLGRIIEQNPLETVATNPSRLIVAFPLDADSLARATGLLSTDWAPELFAVGSEAAYLWHPEGITESALSKAFSRSTGAGFTARNWTTVLKLYAAARQQTGD